MTDKAQGERELFERTMKEVFGDDEQFDRDEHGRYNNRAWQDAYIGWIHRAGIASRAALKAQPAPTDAQGELQAAAAAVVARWDSPKWKDEPHTAVFIDRLRNALGDAGITASVAPVKSPENDTKPGETRMNSGAPGAGQNVKSADLACSSCGLTMDQSRILAVQGEDSARLEWKRITAPGQVKVGDKLRFTIGDVLFNERVKQIINPGYPDEELIYNKRRNFYVITSNAITNFGSSKNVEYLARASSETGGVKS